MMFSVNESQVLVSAKNTDKINPDEVLVIGNTIGVRDGGTRIKLADVDPNKQTIATALPALRFGVTFDDEVSA